MKKQAKKTIESTLKADISERINLTEKHLPYNQTLGWYEDFTANGKKYRVESWKSYMPPLRYIAWQKWNLIAATGKSFQEFYDDVLDLEKTFIQSYSDKEKIYDVSVKLNAMKQSIINFGDKRYFACYMLSCIFFVRENENVLEFNEDFQETKINDLIIEGFDSRDFFQFALSSIQGFQSAYNSLKAV